MLLQTPVQQCFERITISSERMEAAGFQQPVLFFTATNDNPLARLSFQLLTPTQSSYGGKDGRKETDFVVNNTLLYFLLHISNVKNMSYGTQLKSDKKADK
jgi:hypothetical protein